MDPHPSSAEANGGSRQTEAGQHQSPPNNATSNGPPQYIKDADFWYWDGNVVLAHGNTIFKLHASRLSTHSGYFRELFAPGGGPTALAPPSVAEGCGMYQLPKELSLTAFKCFLKALESPWEYAKNPPSPHLTNSLLFLAHTLSCDLILNLAKNRLREIWGGRVPPSALTESPGSDRQDFIAAIHAIHLAREHSIPGVLKRALYEVLSSGAFWRALDSAVSGEVSLRFLGPLRMAGKDLYRLVSARTKLCERWREFVMQVPEGTAYIYRRNTYETDTLTHWCCQQSEEMRTGRWRSFVFEKGGLEVIDPIRYDFMAEWGTELLEEKKWCRACLDRKRKAWEEKRVEWWNGMAELLSL